MGAATGAIRGAAGFTSVDETIGLAFVARVVANNSPVKIARRPVSIVPHPKNRRQVIIQPKGYRMASSSCRGFREGFGAMIPRRNTV
jgi:hypothetical protein